MLVSYRPLAWLNPGKSHCVWPQTAQRWTREQERLSNLPKLPSKRHRCGQSSIRDHCSHSSQLACDNHKSPRPHSSKETLEGDASAAQRPPLRHRRDSHKKKCRPSRT